MCMTGIQDTFSDAMFLGGYFNIIYIFINNCDYHVLKAYKQRWHTMALPSIEINKRQLRISLSDV